MPENLNRRQFLKALGLAGAGASLTIGAKAGLAEAANSTPGEAAKKFWWVKSVDKCTTEIDWKNMKRFNEWETTRGSHTAYIGANRTQQLNEIAAANAKAWNGKKNGYMLKDYALQGAVANPDGNPISFLGPQKVQTPEDRGMPRYEGSPEEAAKMIRVALRHLGALSVGFVELEDETTKKLIYNEEPAPARRKNVFEDIDVGYQTDEKNAIPNKARWMIVFTIQMSGEAMRYSPTITGSQTTGLAYQRMWLITAQLSEFLRGLGYNGYGASAFNGLGIMPAFGVLGGLGEMSRTNRMITPEEGPNVRVSGLLTDLPLAPTKPIDFGVMEFCKDCMICAQECPSRSLSFDREPSWEPQGPWGNTGHKAYFENSATCRNFWRQVLTNCGICFAVCPYSKQDEATIHQVWKATAAKTSMFNNTIARINHQVYETLKDPEEFWQKEDMAVLGIDTKIGKLRV